MKNKSQKGFTLVEIMIVVVIIGLLAAMAIPAFQKVRETSQVKTITNNLRQLATGAETYFLEEGVNAVQSADLVADGSYVKSFDSVSKTGDDYTANITTSLDSLSAQHPNGTDTVTILF